VSKDILLLSALGVAIVLAVYLSYKFSRKASKKLLALEAINIRAINEKFGAELQTQNEASTNEYRSWYVSLRKTHSHVWPNRYDPSFKVSSDLIIRNQSNNYWHLLMTSGTSGWKNEVFSEGQLIATSLNEHRVRQVLFTHPELYSAAFGKSPESTDLK
jgi:hypothetical protein